MATKAAPAARRQQTSVACAAEPKSRSAVLRQGAAAAATLVALSPSSAALAKGEPKPKGPITSSLVDAETAAKIEDAPRQKTASGLEYIDIVEGSGPKAPNGFQVTAHYVAMTPAGNSFDDSVQKGTPYDIRVGAGQVIPGLDEGIRTMKVGGLRRLYIPGELGFPKGLPSAPGRPRVPPNSPLIFDVKLLYIPGFDTDDE
ncbi:unnamed protein product [Pedinophyceae sp. YPF-701]|nr:unnamed protein product [Pedinophyceae sp. YPF-701]